MNETTTRIGLVAGSGNYPLHVIEGAHEEGCQVAAVAIHGSADPEVERLADRSVWLKPGHLQKMIDFFREHEVRELVFAGKIQHVRVFRDFVLDKRAAKILFGMKDRRADKLLGAAAAEFEKEGLVVADSTKYLRSSLAREGQLGKRKLTDQQEADVQVGFQVAKALAGFDVGQTIVMNKGVVVALEGVEGTDEAIRRAASLSGDGIVVVKVSKPNQDFRFDVPVVGLETFKVLAEVKASCLAIEAGRTLFFDQEESIALADKNKIVVVAQEIDNPDENNKAKE